MERAFVNAWLHWVCSVRKLVEKLNTPALLPPCLLRKLFLPSFAATPQAETFARRADTAVDRGAFAKRQHVRRYFMARFEVWILIFQDLFVVILNAPSPLFHCIGLHCSGMAEVTPTTWEEFSISYRHNLGTFVGSGC